MNKKWKIENLPDVDEVSSLSKSINVNEIHASILVRRGIKTFDQAKEFFRPKLEDIHDPFLMKDMDRAVERLIQARNNGDPVMIYGDYDVDGTTSVSLVYSFLREVGMEVVHYIPDRYKEGYGVSYAGIDFADDNDIGLIIALDCGIKAIDKIEYANSKSIDFIICDHHRPGDDLPKAVAVLDPKREDCEYPYKELCGCGVGFKLMQALSIKESMDMDVLFSYLDLVAIAIGADIVPITGENRIFCYYGLQLINTEPRIGIKKMLEVAKRKEKLTITDLVFVIAPRINAAGRIDSGMRAVELLCEENPDNITELVDRINAYNIQRKELDQTITKEALEMISEDSWYDGAMSTVVYSEDWHKGVVGIVASRIIEKHYKPTIVLTESDGKYTGSARSVKHFDVYNAIDSCNDLLLNFGGHKYAAGLTMEKDNIDEFKQRFEDYVSEHMKEEWLLPEIIISQELLFSQITDNFYGILKQMGPFGPSNMKPVFISKNCMDSGYSRLLKESHIKFNIYQGDSPKIKMNGIAFNLVDKMKLVESKKPFDIVYTIEENHWNGKTTLQLMIKDIRLSEQN